jgi:hypothetical protein
MTVIRSPKERTAAYRAARLSEQVDTIAMQMCVEQSRDMRDLLRITAKRDARMLARAAALLPRDSYNQLAIAQAEQTARFNRRTQVRTVEFRLDLVASPR